MSVTVKVFTATKVLDISAETQYTCGTSKTAIIDKVVAFNNSTTLSNTVTVSVCQVLDTPSASNQLVQKTIQPNEYYLFPELTGLALAEGDRVVTDTAPSDGGVGETVVFRMSGREIT